jgi:L,D-peptidoglycan transpeptidase YkuD (ErfK/YbiS/YcfS/YnhG family)
LPGARGWRACLAQNCCYGHFCPLITPSARQVAVRKIVTDIHVRAISMRTTKGIMAVGPLRFPCVIGRSGRSHGKKEGDGATPVGRWQLLRIVYRADRTLPPGSRLPARAMAVSEGWCDAAGDRNYNRPVRLPYPASHEVMRRADGLYDLVVILSHNQRPRSQGRGSAVFLHLMDPDGKPTAGCVALSRRDMATVLSFCGRRTCLAVWPIPGFRKSPTPPARRSRRR